MKSRAAEHHAVTIEQLPNAAMVELVDGRVVPDVFSASFRDVGFATIDVWVAAGVPYVMRIELAADRATDGSEIAALALRTMPGTRWLRQALATAVQAASETAGARRVWRERELAARTPVRKHMGRRTAAADLEQFVTAYRATTGTVAERAAQLHYSRAAVHRKLAQAVERGVITERERAKL